MKLHRITVLTISLLCVSAYVHAVEPVGKDTREGRSGEDGHRERGGGGEGDGRGQGPGGGATQTHAAATYATVQAIVDYCSHVDPGHRSEYAQLGDVALRSAGSRGDDDSYPQAYANISVSLEQVPTRSALATCQAGIAGFTAK